MKKLSLIAASVLLSAGLVAYAVHSNSSKVGKECSTASTCDPKDCSEGCCIASCCDSK